MLINEYFNSSVKQRSAAFRINDYLNDKEVEYHIFYNINNLEDQLKPENELPKRFSSEDLKKYYTPGFFKKDKYLCIELQGKLLEYKDIKANNIDDQMNKNFVDESYALSQQAQYIESLSQKIGEMLLSIMKNENLIERTE